MPNNTVRAEGVRRGATLCRGNHSNPPLSGVSKGFNLWKGRKRVSESFNLLDTHSLATSSPPCVNRLPREP